VKKKFEAITSLVGEGEKEKREDGGELKFPRLDGTERDATEASQ